MSTEFAALFPDEVVTRAYTRLVDAPGLSGKLALITIDNGHDHTRPSTFGPGGLASLNAALDEAFAAEPAAIVRTGPRSHPFALVSLIVPVVGRGESRCAAQRYQRRPFRP